MNGEGVRGFGADEAMSTRIFADGRDYEVMAPCHAFWDYAAAVLLTDYRARGRRCAPLRAAIGLALSFDTWRTLATDYDLSDDEPANVAMRLVNSS